MEPLPAIPTAPAPLRDWVRRTNCTGIVTVPDPDSPDPDATLSRRCLNRATIGSTRYIWHGGNNPAQRNKIQDRLDAYRYALLEELAPPALQFLHDLISDPHAPQRLRLQAARDILDRTGLTSITRVADVSLQQLAGDLDAQRTSGHSELDDVISSLFQRRLQQAQEANTAQAQSITADAINVISHLQGIDPEEDSGLASEDALSDILTSD